jgi:hypothetical protein
LYGPFKEKEMRNLFNMIALVATAFTMFYLGKSCTIKDCADTPVTVVDSSAINRLAEMYEIVDSIKEQNRELEVIIVRQQDSLTNVKQMLQYYEQRSARYVTLYTQAIQKKDMPAVIKSCDSIVFDYALYREACEDYVLTADSIMSEQYEINVAHKRTEALQQHVIEEFAEKYNEALKLNGYTQTEKNIAEKRRKKWRNIAAGLAAFIGLSILAR